MKLVLHQYSHNKKLFYDVCILAPVLINATEHGFRNEQYENDDTQWQYRHEAVASHTAWRTPFRMRGLGTLIKIIKHWFS